ncbi:hypothetical protein NIES3275_61390 [Microchaete diplosiphon NIES-3275]|nr:hypothetical protein NIES3275_61390 [Microchaete diplosiphon NIES-3275]
MYNQEENSKQESNKKNKSNETSSRKQPLNKGIPKKREH